MTIRESLFAENAINGLANERQTETNEQITTDAGDAEDVGGSKQIVSIKTKQDSTETDNDKDTETVTYVDCPDYDFPQKDTIGEMERELEEMIRANHVKT